MSTSWEEAVTRYRATAPAADVSACYFDLPTRHAAERFAASEEFAQAAQLLRPAPGRRLVELGAGLGIATWAWARAGWEVAAVEPDPSEQVGAGCVRQLCHALDAVRVLDSTAESVPLPDGWADAVYARQMLHHARDLDQVMREAARLLRPGGLFLACRDHVVDGEADLGEFLAAHPLHRLYGGEHAYPAQRYRQAAAAAGLTERGAWGPEESVINYFPGTGAQLGERRRQVARSTWRPVGALLAGLEAFQTYAVRRADARHRPAGRLYSFLWQKV